LINQGDPIFWRHLLPPGDVETADQVDIEWTDYEKRRYNKYKAHWLRRALRGPAAAVPRSSKIFQMTLILSVNESM